MTITVVDSTEIVAKSESANAVKKACTDGPCKGKALTNTAV